MKSFTKLASLLTTCGLLFGVGGGCLPDNFFVDKAGEITNGLLISAINLLLAPTGLAI
ncbi:MAG: hypothetical protein JSV03_17225 [Planctomycetota bacterium]|nr:MAG: hypothetical protein JSV03_17225 [Planctomycetota bacterium]